MIRLPHRIALIGAGNVVQRFFVPVLRARPNIQVNVVCSAFGQSAQGIAGMLGNPDVATDYRTVVNRPDVDTIFICTPPYTHLAIAGYALRRGKNVLVEKPVCASFDEFRKLRAIAGSSQAVLSATFNNCAREENSWLTSQVLQGAIGKIEFIEAEWFRTKPRPLDKAWTADARMAGGGGVLADLGAHLIAIALGLMPNRRQFNAYCSAGYHGGTPDGLEDIAAVTIVIDGHLQIVLRTGWGMKLIQPTRFNIRAYGTQGCVASTDFDGPTTDGYGHVIDAFMRHIESATKPSLAPVSDTMRLLHALYDSIRLGRRISGKFLKS